MAYPNWMTNEAQRAVLDNARRLYADAALLFENRRFPTALSVAILAWEEIGKIYLHAIDWNLEPAEDRPKHSHVEKQRLAHTLALANAGIPILQEILSAVWGGPIDAKTAEALIIALQVTPDHPMFKGRAAEMLQDIATAMADGLKGTPAAERHVLISMRGMDKQKQSGFYCDIDGEKIVSSPAFITKEDAEEILQLVAKAIAIMDSE